MPVNLELKIKVDSHIPYRKILKNTGAKNRGVLNQKDIYYQVPSGLLKLRIENGNESLILYERDESGKKRWSDYRVIYFKSKKSEKIFSSVFEIETVVEKKRELFLFDNTRIHLDTVKNLGKFLELETLVVRGKKDAQKRFDNIIKLLKLDTSKQIRNSYRDLMIGKVNK
ncbi:CYTH domain protein [bacterium BMS3Abin03]|nr:CYTH domain protein [bacterium BMS3Abin03]